MTPEQKAIRDLLRIVERHRDSLVECHSLLRRKKGGGTEVIPGTLDLDVRAKVAAMDRAIEAGRAILARRVMRII